MALSPGSRGGRSLPRPGRFWGLVCRGQRTGRSALSPSPSESHAAARVQTPGPACRPPAASVVFSETQPPALPVGSTCPAASTSRAASALPHVLVLRGLLPPAGATVPLRAPVPADSPRACPRARPRGSCLLRWFSYPDSVCSKTATRSKAGGWALPTAPSTQLGERGQGAANITISFPIQ